MTEAFEIAQNIVGRAGATPQLRSMDEARNWVMTHWPDWADWIGHQMLDNISEAVLAASEKGA